MQFYAKKCLLDSPKKLAKTRCSKDHWPPEDDGPEKWIVIPKTMEPLGRVIFGSIAKENFSLRTAPKHGPSVLPRCCLLYHHQGESPREYPSRGGMSNESSFALVAISCPLNPCRAQTWRSANQLFSSIVPFITKKTNHTYRTLLANATKRVSDMQMFLKPCCCDSPIHTVYPSDAAFQLTPVLQARSEQRNCRR